MKKIYSKIMMLAMMLAAFNFSACSSSSDDNGSDNGGGAKGNSSLTLTTAEGTKYVLLSYHQAFVSEGDNINGNLADDATIFWYMTPQDSWSPQYVHILLGKQMSISDFPKGYDLGEPTISFGIIRSYENEYDYDSGSIKVTNNDGKSFTLEFNHYKASKSSSASITINGTLYVEKERYH